MGNSHIAIKYTPAGEVERLPDGGLRFPAGGTMELNGVERRVMAGDEIAIQIGKDGSAVLLINGKPAEEIPLDS